MECDKHNKVWMGEQSKNNMHFPLNFFKAGEQWSIRMAELVMHTHKYYDPAMGKKIVEVQNIKKVDKKNKLMTVSKVLTNSQTM